jgi:hypothetical protein
VRREVGQAVVLSNLPGLGALLRVVTALRPGVILRQLPFDLRYQLFALHRIGILRREGTLCGWVIHPNVSSLPGLRQLCAGQVTALILGAGISNRRWASEG